MQKNNIILCFCKHPVAGLVKSRLAKDLGIVPAANIYKILLDETVATLGMLNFKVILYCYPDTIHPSFKQYETEFNVTLEKQHGENLGMKMHGAIKNHLHADTKVVLIGSDCLELDSAYIHKAFEYLDAGSDIVIGPATDGGYALLGANKIDKSIFEDINWSSHQVLHQTINKIKTLDWSYRLLSNVRDLDNLEDYYYYLKHEKYQKLFD